MLQPAENAAGSLVVEGTRIDLIERGAGRPLLFLHAENGMAPATAAIDELGKAARVIAPTHPGFGRSDVAPGMRTVDDLSYFYLDLLDRLDVTDLTVVGVSLGAWIAAEIAVKSTARMSRLVMANAVGIKVGDRQTRDIADIFALTEPEYLAIDLLRPECRAVRLQGAAGRRGTRRRARARGHRALCLESVLPQSPAQKPAAPHPRSDAVSVGRPRPHAQRALWPRLLRNDSGRALRTIERAGHFPHQEQPKVFAERVLAFAAGK